LLLLLLLPSLPSPLFPLLLLLLPSLPSPLFPLLLLLLPSLPSPLFPLLLLLPCCDASAEARGAELCKVTSWSGSAFACDDVAAAAAAAAAAPSAAAAPPKLDRPKSDSLMCPVWEMSRLSGFRSRWMMPCSQEVMMDHNEKQQALLTNGMMVPFYPVTHYYTRSTN
jgi:hypothetical protein